MKIRSAIIAFVCIACLAAAACTVHLVTLQVGDGHKTTTTGPASQPSKSFMERVIEDI